MCGGSKLKQVFKSLPIQFRFKQKRRSKIRKMQKEQIRHKIKHVKEKETKIGGKYICSTTSKNYTFTNRNCKMCFAIIGSLYGVSQFLSSKRDGTRSRKWFSKKEHTGGDVLNTATDKHTGCQEKTPALPR